MQRLIRNVLIPTIVTALTACGGDADPAVRMGQPADAPGATSISSSENAAPGVAEGQLLDPEVATREELTTVSGIDAALADRIVAGRPYGDMTEVDAVLAERLDEAQREAVYRRLWKPIDLNGASDEEILLIPNLGRRMLHEFKEYRPYRAIEQFRREIGKYVDDEEVARLEQYVEVR